MKRILAVLLIVAMIFSLAACGGTSKDEGKNDGINVDEGLLNVDITMPASMFEGQTDQEILDDAAENDYKCVVNEDGSVTYTLSKKQQREALKEMKEDLDEVIQECLEGEDALESFEAITYNSDLTKFTIKANEKYGTGFDNFAALGFMITSSYYQLFAGKDPESIDCVITFVDYKTNEEIDTVSMKELGEE